MCGWAGGRREVGRGDARPLQQSDSNNRDWDSRLRHSRLRQMTDSDSRLRQTTDSENRLDQSSIRRLGWPPEVSESAHLGWAHGPARTHRLGFRSRPWPGSGPLPRRRSLLLRTRPPFPPFPPARPAASRPGRGRREDAGGSMLLRRRLGAWRCRQRLEGPSESAIRVAGRCRGPASRNRCVRRSRVARPFACGAACAGQGWLGSARLSRV